MAINKLTINELVADLEPSLKSAVEYIRNTILAIHPEIDEQVKWNSPSFYYAGKMAAFNPKEYKRDILVCNLHRGKILLVFPTGSTITDHLGGKNYPDGRKIITVEDLTDFKLKENNIIEIVSQWLTLANDSLSD